MTIDEYLHNTHQLFDLDDYPVTIDSLNLLNSLLAHVIKNHDKLNIRLIPLASSAVFPKTIVLGKADYILWDYRYWLYYHNFLLQCGINEYNHKVKKHLPIMMKLNYTQLLSDLFERNPVLSFTFRRYALDYKAIFNENAKVILSPQKDEEIIKKVEQQYLATQLFVLFHEVYHKLFFIYPNHYNDVSHSVSRLANIIRDQYMEKHKDESDENCRIYLEYIPHMLKCNLEEFCCDFVAIQISAEFLARIKGIPEEKAVHIIYEAYEYNMFFLQTANALYNRYNFLIEDVFKESGRIFKKGDVVRRKHKLSQEEFYDLIQSKNYNNAQYKVLAEDLFKEVTQNFEEHIWSINMFESSSNRINIMYEIILCHLAVSKNVSVTRPYYNNILSMMELTNELANIEHIFNLFSCSERIREICEQTGISKKQLHILRGIL